MDAADSDVVETVLAGKTDEFRHLVDRYSRSIYRLAFRLTRNGHDADDVVQETFLRAYRNLDSFDGRAQFSTWLHRIATNYALDLLRRSEHRPAEQLDEGEFERIADEGSQGGSDQLVHQLGVRDALAKGMTELSRNERTAFVLRHYEGMSIEEIGQTLGTEINATKNTIFRAVRKLRVVLEPLMRTA